MEDGWKQVDPVKKYGLSQSTITTFLKKRKQIEEAVNSNEISPQRKRLKVATNENNDAAILKWLQELKAENVPINGLLTCG
ncbi:hypothetical protein AVEN_206124-1 [Araneus ventricosus]|uniref:HTH psq-type domain-containing protein n=1 Tax=Araneus ventricosus TaxID=182803 RepID=A0A4Y2PJ86_ARAVE|nr:hypothetical protein AVEN_195776-1 [Araneus ventricosus]GBN50685.1 hypothetical protein AVEN_137145-1 [Araneus ventricosus]GBN50742.1 hypothetical protein AVEN_183783-1 [Araneus ventricosus]GBN50760.1 hypothetical protein AVEN_206124-1 [Araneus ventricosus]